VAINEDIMRAEGGDQVKFKAGRVVMAGRNGEIEWRARRGRTSHLATRAKFMTDRNPKVGDTQQETAVVAGYSGRTSLMKPPRLVPLWLPGYRTQCLGGEIHRKTGNLYKGCSPKPNYKRKMVY